MSLEKKRIFFNNGTIEDLTSFSAVYLQFFSYNGTMVWDNTNEQMVDIDEATYADTACTVSSNSDFNVYYFMVPSGLNPGRYTWRLMGQTGASPANTDTFIAAGNIAVGKNAGLDETIQFPLSLE